MSKYVQGKLAAGEPLHLFVTGGAGPVGRPLVRRAVAAGHRVRALSCGGAATDAALAGLGAEPVRGRLDDLDLLRSEAFDADAAVHLAACEEEEEEEDDDDGGVGDDAAAVERDQAAAAALTTGLTAGIRDVDKPLVVAFALAPTRTQPEDPAAAPHHGPKDNTTAMTPPPPLGPRAASEARARARGAVAVRIATPLADSHGHGHGHGHSRHDSFATAALVAQAAGPSADDVARLLLAAVARGRPGAAYDATTAAGDEMVRDELGWKPCGEGGGGGGWKGEVVG